MRVRVNLKSDPISLVVLSATGEEHQQMELINELNEQQAEVVLRVPPSPVPSAPALPRRTEIGLALRRPSSGYDVRDGVPIRAPFFSAEESMVSVGASMGTVRWRMYTDQVVLEAKDPATQVWYEVPCFVETTPYLP